MSPAYYSEYETAGEQVNLILVFLVLFVEELQNKTLISLSLNNEIVQMF